MSQPNIIFVLLLVALSFLLGLAVSRWMMGKGVRGPTTKQPEQTKGAEDCDRNDQQETLQTLADSLSDLAENSAHPKDLLSDPRFQRGVDQLMQQDRPVAELTDYLFGGNWVIGLMAAQALSQREDGAAATKRILDNIGDASQWPLYFRLQVLSRHAKGATIGKVLGGAGEWWLEQPFTVKTLEEYLRQRSQSDEPLSLGDGLEGCDSNQFQVIRRLLRKFDQSLAAPLLEELKAVEHRRVDRGFLRSIGRLWTTPVEGPPVVTTEKISDYFDQMNGAFRERHPRPILLVGEAGVGKTALRRMFSEMLIQSGWQILETSGQNLIADKKYIGEIEGQVKKLSANARTSKRIALYIDRLHEFASAGAYRQSPQSVLDQLWKDIENQEIFIVSETTPRAFAALTRKYPGISAVMKVISVEAMEEAEACSLAARWLATLNGRESEEHFEPAVAEAHQLSSQYLSHQALPGRLLALLGLGLLRAKSQPLSRDHLIDALGELSGLPRTVLDERQSLDVSQLRQQFTRRIVGQPEAVNCLVERIAMLKAGLNDPGRPVGVFLFAGPTGTGKTEIAKTLAQVLFASEQQMIRLDMSEYRSANSAARLLAVEDDRGVGPESLVNMVRKRPFSVVLLDEFEKSSSDVWDLFLQVFDDGRLTDARGDTVDFRHTIIILTSNLGATISNTAGIGFTGAAGQFSKNEVMRAVDKSFRREFINRLDQVVVFNPLSREVMRGILKRELQKALTRRGLRGKSWAVEWEDSAIEFLLHKGFTPDLGARPLRRAIDRHLLAPLSMTMVENRVPEGDQFLFVRSNGESIDVEFVDPDADVSQLPSADQVSPGTHSVPGLILRSSGSDEARQFLCTRVAQVVEQVKTAPFLERKAKLIEEMNQEGFWDLEQRYQVLDRIELMDRVESAARVLEPLALRLQSARGSARLAGQVAQKVYVLEYGIEDINKDRPTQVQISVRLLPDEANPGNSTHAQSFLDRLAQMYLSWARSRRMLIKQQPVSRDEADQRFLVSGFGCYAILSSEEGLHVLEYPVAENRSARIRVRVSAKAIVASADGGQPGLDSEPVQSGPKGDAETTGAATANRIVRRYREQPSPLVRDEVHGWRSGRIEQVWSGNFDLMSAETDH